MQGRGKWSGFFGMAAFGIIAATAAAQAALDSKKPIEARLSPEGFLARHGSGWKVAPAPFTGAPSFVYGKSFATPIAPRSAAEMDAAARWAIDENVDLFGVDSTTLVHDQTKFLDLARVGSSSKWVVKYHQELDGIPVINGNVSVLFDDAERRVIGMDSTAIPFADQISTTPAVSHLEAIEAAEAAYALEMGVAATAVGAVELVVAAPSPYFGAKGAIGSLGPTLAYQIELSTPGLVDEGGLPYKARVFVSAQADLSVLKVENRVYTFGTIDGNVKGNVNTGLEPNDSSNQEQPNLENLWVRQNNAGGAILDTTDAAGNFSIGQMGSLTLFFELRGPYFDVNNVAGTSASFTVVANDVTPTNILFNPTKAELTTAEVAGAYWVNTFRNFVIGTDPADTSMDFNVVTNVNLSSTCNAFYDGSSINMYQSGGGCPNTAYQSVIDHEEGHWANEVYNGFVTGAFHEGAADAWASYIGDSPCLGPDFFGPGTGCLRDGEQTSIMKCPGDCDESCNGGAVHTEGQAIASALWKVRRNLEITHGVGPGGAIASALLLSWFQAFDDTAICNVIADHWVCLDDDNGNLSDGTPNFGDIDGGFVEQGWPGITLPDVVITNVLGPSANQGVSHMQPQSITATITSAGGVVSAANVFYSTNDGASYSPVAMAPTGNPDEFSAKIPGVASPDSIRWYVSGTSSVGNTATEPGDAPGDYFLYHSGIVTALQSYDFEAGNDQGWTHVCLAGAQFCDQWERADPANSNASTDPPSAFSGSTVWGTDLSAQGFDGMYEPNTDSELRSPVFNLSGASNVRLQFRRFLSVEEGIFDQATVNVNGTPVWSNPASGNLLDSEWTLQDLDITSLAAGNPAVQISWRLAADGGLEFGGWNIDNFDLVQIDPAPAGTFTQYGTGCPGTGGLVPDLNGTGIPTACGPITINLTNGRPNGTGFLYFSALQDSVPFGACTLYLGTPFFLLTKLALNGAGAASLGGNLPSIPPDVHIYFQYLAFDPGAPVGNIAASNGLDMFVQ